MFFKESFFKIHLIWAFVFLLLVTSCSSIFTKFYGIKKYKTVDQETIEKFANKFNINTENCYQLDSSFLTYLKLMDTNLYAVQINNHSQPLQVLYYDKNSKLVSYHVNCYAGGFPNLKWNRNGAFETFPPKQQAPVDSLMSIQTHFDYIKTLDNKQVGVSGVNSDYIVFVYWSRFMGRQSKKYIRLIQKNLEIDKTKKVTVYYINNDNFFKSTLSK